MTGRQPSLGVRCSFPELMVLRARPGVVYDQLGRVVCPGVSAAASGQGRASGKG